MSVIDLFFSSLTERRAPLPACNDDGGDALTDLDEYQEDQVQRWGAAIETDSPVAHSAPDNID